MKRFDLAPFSPPPLPHGRGVGVGLLRQQSAGDALEAAVRANVAEQLGVGTEADAHALDEGGGIERVGGDDRLGEALRTNVGLQRADLLEHDALTLEQVGLDVLLRGGEDRDDVGLGGGGGKLDVFGELGEVVITGLLGAVGGILDALGALGVGATHNLIRNRHNV